MIYQTMLVQLFGYMLMMSYCTPLSNQKKTAWDSNKTYICLKNGKMSFNVKKCEFLRITNRISFVSSQYLLHNQIIHEVNHAKYLGVVIDSNLSWSQHIKEISNKANDVKSFLQQNLHNCPPSLKANCYTSLIKPILESACVVWAPHTNKDMFSIESVQKRATRFVFINYCTTYFECHWIVTKIKLEATGTLPKLKAIHMFKIIHNLIDIPANTHLIPLSSDHNTRCHQWRFKQPMMRINSYSHSFFPSAIKIWNSLNDDIVSSTTLNQLKQKLPGLDLSL